MASLDLAGSLGPTARAGTITAPRAALALPAVPTPAPTGWPVPARPGSGPVVAPSAVAVAGS
jgi:hypothetical protein